MNIWRYEAGALESAHDELAEEEPLEIRVKNRAVSVTMRTPGHDEELAAGFLLTEGIVGGPADILRVELCAHDRGGNILNVILSDQTSVDFERLTRHVFASSSCGLCGKATIDAVHQRLDPIEDDLHVRAEVLLALPDRLRQAQQTFDRTGGLHAAGIFTIDGEAVVVREDVGRHNAVDKVLGYGLLRGLLPFHRHVLMVSGRSSFEIMQKALAGRVPIVAAVSAPSSLAVDFAKESGQTLVGFLRGSRMNVYCEKQRIIAT
ncbi:MAG TPA: formate dehydrogenase accessory sulfurtransferase FdhD [Tepidisphaeraceae bacterium]|nr:formate dehydrogenase accessory sulfurtransferase FdhD [Tepidisphaeraceae bacterium]